MVELQKDWMTMSELPVDGCFPCLLQPGVGFGEVPAAEPAPVRRQWRRVCSGEHVVLVGVNERALVDSVVAPKQEHKSLALLRQPLDGTVGEALPSVVLMRARGVLAYRQRGVQQQHTLLCPLLQVAAGRGHKPHVVMQLLEDVDERLRERHAVLHRETQPVGLSHLVVGVLPDDHHLHLVKRRAVEGVEDAVARRKHTVMLLLLH